MRIIKHLSLALLLVGLTFAGCKKDNQLNPATKSDGQSMSKTTKQLLAFRNNLMLKSGGSMPMDSATWYLEGLLNYENANNDHQFDGLEFFHDTLLMSCTGSSLSMAELNDAYDYLTAKINSIAQTQSIPDFAFDAIDISIEKSGLNNSETKVTMALGGGSAEIGGYVAFGITDYWNWGLGGGKCDVYAGQGGNSDAAQQLNYKFNHPMGMPRPGYFTDIIPIDANYWEYPDPSNPGPYCDNKIFHFNAGNTGIWPCLAPNELNYYLSTLSYIIINEKPTEPLGLSYSNVSVTAWFPPDFTNNYFHVYTLRYGIFHQPD